MKKKFMITIIACLLLTQNTVTAWAAGATFEFKFTDLDNHEYGTTWQKGNSLNYYTLVLNKSNGLINNTMSSTNIFGCRLADYSVGPAVDVYHTHTKYSTYRYYYQYTASKQDNMRLRGKKDSASTSSTALRISGTVTP